MSDALFTAGYQKVLAALAAGEVLHADTVRVALTAAVPGRMPDQLRDYWTHGEGAAKIRWGTDGSFDRCVRLLRKYFPNDPQGLCARLHKRATGEWPAEKGIQSSAAWWLDASLDLAAAEEEGFEYLGDPDSAAAFHLPGRHNQQTHGNRVGRKGNLPSATGLGSKVRKAREEVGRREIAAEPDERDALRKSIDRANAAKKPAAVTREQAEERIRTSPERPVGNLTRAGLRVRAEALAAADDTNRARLVDEFDRTVRAERQRDAHTAGALAKERFNAYEEEEALTSPEVAAAHLAERRAIEADRFNGVTPSYGANDTSAQRPAKEQTEKIRQANRTNQVDRIRAASEAVNDGDLSQMRNLLGPEPSTQAALDFARATEPNRAGPLAVDDPTPEEAALVERAAEAGIKARAYNALARLWDDRAEKTGGRTAFGSRELSREQQAEAGRIEQDARFESRKFAALEREARDEQHAATVELDRAVNKRNDERTANTRAALTRILDQTGPQPDLAKSRTAGGRAYRKEQGWPTESADKKTLTARDRSGGMGARTDQSAQANRDRGQVAYAAGELSYAKEQEAFLEKYVRGAEAELARDGLDRDTRGILSDRLNTARMQLDSVRTSEIPNAERNLRDAEQRYRENHTGGLKPAELESAINQDAADRERRGRIMLGDAEYERREREKRLGSPAARKQTARELSDISRDEFWELPEQRREAIKQELRDLIAASENDRVTIPSNRTSRGTTIRGATPDYVGQARTALSRFLQPKPEPQAPPDNSIRGRLADAVGPGAGEKLRQIARDIGMTDVNYKAGYLRQQIELELWRQEQAAIRAHAGPVADLADYDTEEAERALAFLDEPDEFVDMIMPMVTRWDGMLAPIGKPTGDRRIFEPGALSNRDLPLPLMWQEKTDDGHSRSSVVGTIETLDHREDGTYGSGRFLDPEMFPDAQKAMALMKARVNGPSVDLDDVTYAMKDAEGQPFDMAAYEAAMIEGKDPAKPLLSVSAGRISGATLVSIPAFAEVAHTWTLRDVPDEDGFSAALAEDMDDCPDCFEAAALAASGYVGPPLAAFVPRKLDGPTPLTVDGTEVYGHLATWSTCHVGFPGTCVTPPHSDSDYAYFHTGEVTTAEGERLAVGRLVLGAPHADLAKGFRAASQHYDDTGRVVALVRAYEDDHGIAFSGVLVHDLDDETRAQFRAMPLSGDWRRVGGAMELIGAISVPVPGFPVARVADARQTALVAAGVLHSGTAQPVDEPQWVAGHVEGPDGQLIEVKFAASPELHALLVGDAARTLGAVEASTPAVTEFAARAQSVLDAVNATIDRERMALLDVPDLGE